MTEVLTATQTGKIETEDSGYLDGSVSDLLCPYCGENYIHSGKVTVFHRREDAGWVTRTIVNDGETRVELVPNSPDNPSARRHGIVIRFWCEICQVEPELQIAQHKGNTHISWLFRLRP